MKNCTDMLFVEVDCSRWIAGTCSFSRQKDGPPEEKAQGLVYSMSCADRDASYARETKNFPKRLRQHKNVVRKFE